MFKKLLITMMFFSSLSLFVFADEDQRIMIYQEQRIQEFYTFNPLIKGAIDQASDACNQSDGKVFMGGHRTDFGITDSKYKKIQETCEKYNNNFELGIEEGQKSIDSIYKTFEEKYRNAKDSSEAEKLFDSNIKELESQVQRYVKKFYATKDKITKTKYAASIIRIKYEQYAIEKIKIATIDEYMRIEFKQKQMKLIQTISWIEKVKDRIGLYNPDGSKYEKILNTITYSTENNISASGKLQELEKALPNLFKYCNKQDSKNRNGKSKFYNTDYSISLRFCGLQYKDEVNKANKIIEEMGFLKKCEKNCNGLATITEIQNSINSISVEVDKLYDIKNQASISRSDDITYSLVIYYLEDQIFLWNAIKDEQGNITKKTKTATSKTKSINKKTKIINKDTIPIDGQGNAVPAISFSWNGEYQWWFNTTTSKREIIPGGKNPVDSIGNPYEPGIISYCQKFYPKTTHAILRIHDGVIYRRDSHLGSDIPQSNTIWQCVE